MFGIGIFELLVILIVAIIALGPNKLPQTIIDIVKFFRAVKKTMAEAKESFDKELQLSEIKQEALKYKQNIENEVNKLTQDIKLDELREISIEQIAKPIEETKKELSTNLGEIKSTLDSLNEPLEYETNQTQNKLDTENTPPHIQPTDSQTTPNIKPLQNHLDSKQDTPHA